MSDVEALAAACAGGHVEKVESLLAKGADANKEDVVFGTPLVAASRGGHSACVLLLLAKGADCDRRSQRDTPLTAAVTSGHLNVAKLLLESGRCDSSTPQGEDTAETNLVVTPGVSADLAEEKERVSKNTKKSNSHRRRDERTHQKPTQTDDPLTLAAKNGDLALVDLLLQHGASPDGGGREGTCDTPLVAAAAGGFEQIVTRLCDAGAKVDGVAKYAGRTALVAAAESEAIGASQCCIKLLEKGADANFVSAGVVGRRLGYGAVHAAAARMDCDLVRALVAAGADPNRRARNTDVENVRSRRAAAARALWGVEGAVERLDNTPLHLAVAAYINEAAKRRVLENQRKAELEEADDDTKNSSVVVAGDRVTQDSETNATKAKRDADTNSTSDSAGSGVSGGVPGEGERSALAVVKTLLECGADHGAFVVDSTPLHMAALGGATDVVDVLMEAGADANARAPNGYTTPLEAAARYAADILLDRRDEKVSSRYRRHRVSDRYARSADDSDTDSRVDELLAARGEYDDDDLSFDDDPRYDDPYGDDGGWYDDDQGSRGEFGRSNRRRDVLFASKMKKSRADRGDLVRDDDDDDDSYDSRESDDDDDSFYGGDDDDAAMAALRDAEGPLRAARHLVTKWHAQVTPHALVGACRAGDELTAFALLDACKKAWDEKKTDLSLEALVKSVARNTTALHAAAESGCVAIARALIEKGSPVDFRRPDDDATPLFVAARGGRPGMIAFLFSQGADIEALCKTADRREGHDTVTPLVEAVMSDQAAAAARLIALGADVKAPNSWMPPLLTATLRSNATITRMLLKEGADPRVGVGGMTPLGLAVMTRQSDLVHALLDWRGDDDGDSTGDDESQSKKPRKAMSTESDGDLFDSPLSMLDAGVAEPGEDPLVIAAARARAREARDAKGKKARKKNKNSPSKFVRVDPDEPIDAAVLDDGDPEMSSACQCPVCQRRGRDGEGRDPAQCTPVDRNANASNNSNPSNSTGGASYGAERHLTPLAAAAKLDDAETVRALLAAGANPERASGGMPPLAHAAGKGSCAAIIALLDGGALLESPASLPLTPRDGRTLTPLGVASEAGELSAVELLLERGADPNGPPNDGFEPPLCCAVTDPPDDEFGNPVVGVVRALIAAGADPNASKEDAQSPYSPLMVAAGAGSVAVVKELLDGGADLEHVVRVTVGDSGGPRGGPDRKCHITALLHAAYCNELDAVRFLLLQGAKLGSADREAMSLVCDHLRSKASVGVPDASATLSLLRHQADAEADEEDEKAEQRLREERARAAELKEERKRARKQDAANAEQDAIKKAEEELLGKAEEEKAEAERLAAKVRKQEEYKKEQELRKREAAAKRAEVKAEKDTKKAAAEAEAAAEKAEQQKVLDEVQKMVADLEIKRKADEAEKELKARREREKVIKEELRLEKAEAEKEALEVAKKQKELAKELKKKESAAAQGAAKGSSETTTVAATAAASVSTGGGLQKPSKAAAVSAAALSAAAAKAHLLARDTAEGFTGPATKVNKDDAAEAASWAQPGGFFVFLCNDSTEEECYERGLMGAPAKFWDNTVDHVKAGTTLVLYNFAARTLTGPYAATGSPKWNEHADAWQGGRGAPPGKRLVSAFPVQVTVGTSPIMEPVTALLGGDFKPSVGGLPLGSPDNTRRDIIVTKLRNAAKEQGMNCPTASERRRSVSIAKAKAYVATSGAAVAAQGTHLTGGTGTQQQSGSKKKGSSPDAVEKTAPAAWAAPPATSVVSTETEQHNSSKGPSPKQTDKAQSSAKGKKSASSPNAKEPLGAETGTGTESDKEKTATKKEKKAAARKALRDAKNTQQGLGASPETSVSKTNPATHQNPKQSSPALAGDAIGAAAISSSSRGQVSPAGQVANAPAYQPQTAPAYQPPAAEYQPSSVSNEYQTQGYLGGLAHTQRAPMATLGGSAIGAAHSVGGDGLAGSGSGFGGGGFGGGGSAFSANAYGGAFASGGGLGLGGGSGGLGAGLGNGGGGWNPLGGFGGGGFGGAAIGSGPLGASAPITGGLFGGGGGIFAAPSSVNPYARGGNSAQQQNAPPPGFNGGNAFGAPGGQQNQHPVGGENNADERPSFAQAEQLFPWLS